MKNITFTATADSAHGKPLSYFGVKDTIEYPVTFKAFENIDEIRAANAYPDDDEVLVWANNKRKAQARAAAFTLILTERKIVKPTLETDELLRLKTVYDGIFAGKKNVDESKALALMALGLDEWPADLKV